MVRCLNPKKPHENRSSTSIASISNTSTVALAESAAEKTPVAIDAQISCQYCKYLLEGAHLGDCVVRALGVLQDRYVASHHVGHVGEHPHGRYERNADLTPLLQVDGGTAIRARVGGGGHVPELTRDGGSPEFDSKASRLNLRPPQTSIAHRKLRAGDGELDAANHGVQSLAIFFVQIVPGVEAEDFAAELRRQGRRVKRL